jgi:2-polyprenyl-6-methoxyphenol hydroxylase-like FAD-dependent oxidoreductase
MATAVVIGGSVSGLATALALSDAGHRVRILERCSLIPPDTAEGAHREWHRPTVPQAVHSHAFASLGCNLVKDRAPDVYQALVDAGAVEIRLGERMPPTLSDHTPQPGDEDLLMLGCRRTTFEAVLWGRVLDRSGVRVEMDCTVRGLELARNGSTRVVGVRTADGRVIEGDIVVDASGRRTAAPRWLAAAGLPVPEQTSLPADITYYTRFYRLQVEAPPGPLNRGFGAGGLWSHYTGVLFLGDNGTFSVSIGVLPDDVPMKALRAEPAFTAAVRATPLLAPWIAPGVSEPISKVHAMGGLDNSLRQLAGTPPLPGFFPLGDAAGTTNPAYGRGVSLAVAHAYRLADLLAEQPDVTTGQAAEWGRASESLLGPWFAEAVQNDRGRAALWRATVTGAQPQQPPPGVVTFGAVAQAAATDPVVWRRLVRVMMALDPPETVYRDDEVRERVGRALAGGGPGGPGPGGPPAPSRPELVDVVTGAAG